MWSWVGEGGCLKGLAHTDAEAHMYEVWKLRWDCTQQSSVPKPQILLFGVFNGRNEAHPLLIAIFRVNCYLDSNHVNKYRLVLDQTSKYHSLAKLMLEIQSAQAPLPIPFPA